MKIRLTLLFLLITFIACSTFKRQYDSNMARNSIAPLLEKYRDSLEVRRYGIVASIRKNGGIEKCAIGFSDSTHEMTTDKIFNIGSLTKMFTAVLIMQEVEKGNLSLNDTIGKYFSRSYVFNKNVDLQITIEQLLRHESGLGEIVVDTIVNQAFFNFFYAYNNDLLYNKIPEKIFDKGERFKYTNTNYILLGYVLELINDEPYSELLKERIFGPCEMKNTYSFLPKADSDIAHPMYEGQDLLEFVTYKYYYDYGFSAGCIFSNIEDLNRFFINLYETERLITRESFGQMCTFKNDYGYGIQKIPILGENVYYIGHGGDNLSYTNRNFYNPKTRTLVVLMANHLYDKYCWEIGCEMLYEFDK